MATETMIPVINVKKLGFVKRSTIDDEGNIERTVYGPGETFEVPESEMDRLGSHGSIITVEEHNKQQQAEYDAGAENLERLREKLTKTAPKGVNTKSKSKGEADAAK